MAKEYSESFRFSFLLDVSVILNKEIQFKTYKIQNSTIKKLWYIEYKITSKTIFYVNLFDLLQKHRVIVYYVFNCGKFHIFKLDILSFQSEI